MQTQQHSSHPVLSQTENNTTLWIGHSPADPTDHFGGQIFKLPVEGLINTIQVYSTAVNQPGEILLTLREFDSNNKLWGTIIGNASRFLQLGENKRWVRFGMDPVALQKDISYGFILQTNDALVGIGEAATATKNPFDFGYEWNADSNNIQGHYFTYFSLAFKVEMVA
jgi:hypothetical protein